MQKTYLKDTMFCQKNACDAEYIDAEYIFFYSKTVYLYDRITSHSIVYCTIMTHDIVHQSQNHIFHLFDCVDLQNQPFFFSLSCVVNPQSYSLFKEGLHHGGNIRFLRQQTQLTTSEKIIKWTAPIRCVVDVVTQVYWHKDHFYT